MPRSGTIEVIPDYSKEYSCDPQGGSHKDERAYSVLMAQDWAQPQRRR
ncbi:predicted protein [Sclerotinia sclerotiorum 1980 UF-70]|uniref:Uncharacterized protein n=1 Tax=Sclerotinia sclerotiorum (strain ATCC 18683 / 1980 / Ss-1) TaxID=665079 RepID=A7F0G5_SCLS1|nr:predicted protein [Sclerotinia sclerotiorum 1980 UF-70]EDN95207.1 predicted protein [Sclerotinia sclerotiorum 1980 UF-70]